MDRTYNKAELDYLNTKYGAGWIRYPEKAEKKDYVLYPTGDANLSGRIYIAFPKGRLSNEDKIKYNIM